MQVLLSIDATTLKTAMGLDEGTTRQVQAIFRAASRSAPAEFCWFPFSRTRSRTADITHLNVDGIDQNSAYNVWSRLIGGSGGGFLEHWLPTIYSRVVETLTPKINVVYIPTLRRIPSLLPEFRDEYGPPASDGNNLIEELAAYANPSHTRPQDRAKFALVEDFLRGVLKRDVALSIPHDKSTIIVEEYGRYLPIEALGTGIHQLVVLAARAVMTENSVVCIEEPELHFHPELQQQFMHFIASNTSNQYFLTTHSAQIMDAVDCTVHRIRLQDDGSSVVEYPLQRRDRHRICYELGYKPSDLLQANSLIWVEGPSDRLYVLHWLKVAAPELQEGWHFAIMFYGGRLLSHLTLQEAQLEEFIELLPINRFPAVVIDSDKRTDASRINQTKARLKKELEAVAGLAWITKGREIENYLPRTQREAAIKARYGGDCTVADTDDVFGNPLSYKRDAGPIQDVDKLAVARYVTGQNAQTDILDLEAQLRTLVRFIRNANRLSQ